jgi:hypothetical protein
MNSMLLRVFQKQIELQCRAVLKAANDLDTALAVNDVIGSFCAIQSLLSAAANISKALWGDRKTKKALAARKPLRDSLHIDNNSPLYPLKMRNNYDHFDERLDEWWKKSKNHNVVDVSVIPKDLILGFDDIDCFRLYNQQNKELTFWGQRFNLGEIIEAVQQLHPIVLQESNKPRQQGVPPP